MTNEQMPESERLEYWRKRAEIADAKVVELEVNIAMLRDAMMKVERVSSHRSYLWKLARKALGEPV